MGQVKMTKANKGITGLGNGSNKSRFGCLIAKLLIILAVGGTDVLRCEGP